MNRRLLRALQRGGLAAEIEPDRWGIWRGRDRRGRMIGVATGGEVDVLRMRNSLQCFGNEVPTLLVWTGPVNTDEDVRPDAKILEAGPASTRGPLIAVLIARCHDRALRRLVRETVLRYRTDVECESRRAEIGGMNWQGLALGGKIDGGKVQGVKEGVSGAIRRATAALEKICETLGGAEVSFLDRLIIYEQSRSALAHHYAARPALIERRALSSIRALNDVYQFEVGPMR